MPHACRISLRGAACPISARARSSRCALCWPPPAYADCRCTYLSPLTQRVQRATVPTRPRSVHLLHAHTRIEHPPILRPAAQKDAIQLLVLWRRQHCKVSTARGAGGWVCTRVSTHLSHAACPQPLPHPNARHRARSSRRRAAGRRAVHARRKMGGARLTPSWRSSPGRCPPSAGPVPRHRTSHRRRCRLTTSLGQRPSSPVGACGSSRGAPRAHPPGASSRPGPTRRLRKRCSPACDCATGVAPRLQTIHFRHLSRPSEGFGARFSAWTGSSSRLT